MVFDPSYPEIDHDNFHKGDWVNFYGDIKECIPPDMACSGPTQDEIVIILRSRAKTISSLNTVYRAGPTVGCLSLR